MKKNLVRTAVMASVILAGQAMSFAALGTGAPMPRGYVARAGFGGVVHSFLHALGLE
jgi:hypothetical protein